MASKAGILICGETADGKLTVMTRELLQAGQEAADHLKVPLGLLLIGRDSRAAAEEAPALGAETVYCVDDPPFMASLPDRYTAVLAQVCEKTGPALVLLGQTDMGRDVAPRLAALLGTSACLDCIALAFDGETGSLLQTKPVFGGHAMAVWASADHKPHIVTLRPRAADPAEPAASRQGEIVDMADLAGLTPGRGKLVESVKEEVKGIRVEEAGVVVAGGGGLGGAEGFKLLDELAGVLGGAVGISRVPRDEGWLPGGFEIGQTGHIVSPDLYIAVGISGAPQHMAGCAGAKCIVAVNKDPEANIFRESNFGIVGDYRQVLPVLIETFRGAGS
jgi:electron transfer flavoprotein alpha subunit